MTKVMPSRWWVILVWPPESQHSQGGRRSGLDSMWKEFHWGWGGRTHGPGRSQTRPDELRNLEPGVWCRWCPEPSNSWQSHSPTYKPTEEHPDICSYHVNNKLFVMMVGQRGEGQLVGNSRLWSPLLHIWLWLWVPEWLADCFLWPWGWCCHCQNKQTTLQLDDRYSFHTSNRLAIWLWSIASESEFRL